MTRKPLDTKATLYVHRSFMWGGVMVAAGDVFPADLARQSQLVELHKEGYIAHEVIDALAPPAGLEPGTARSPVPARALAPTDEPQPKAEPRHPKHTGPVPPDQTAATAAAAKAAEKAKAAPAGSRPPLFDDSEE